MCLWTKDSYCLNQRPKYAINVQTQLLFHSMNPIYCQPILPIACIYASCQSHPTHQISPFRVSIFTGKKSVDGPAEECAFEQAVCMGAEAVHESEDFLGGDGCGGGAGGSQTLCERPQPFLCCLWSYPFCWDFGLDL